jgi:8-oxoguanine deaminase
LQLFPWLKQPYPIWDAHLDRRDFRLAVRVALTELLISGCTTASDHLFVFPDDMADAVDIEAEEASRLGMRMTLTRGAINLGFADGGIADERLMQDYDVIIADKSASSPDIMIQPTALSCASHWRRARPSTSPSG